MYECDAEFKSESLKPQNMQDNIDFPLKKVDHLVALPPKLSEHSVMFAY